MDVHEIVDPVAQGTPGATRSIAVGGAGHQSGRKPRTARFGTFLLLIETAPLLEQNKVPLHRQMKPLLDTYADHLSHAFDAEGSSGQIKRSPANRSAQSQFAEGGGSVAQPRTPNPT
ncbi:hypothetical protein [Embleya sp. NPDC059259]|uniref:hypothetical protein n=1 Tax=unclassified Embleya TaxID=2699296 RepID=UPI0036CA007E